jgi:hypothetical protein
MVIEAGAEIDSHQPTSTDKLVVRLLCEISWSKGPEEEKWLRHKDDEFTIMTDDLRCIHGHLDPEKANELKRISEVGSYI